MILLVGIFYVLPVSQLMLANQKTARATGNGDMCFYNFLCKRPLLPYVDDFNHIFSNIAYIFCGIYFIVSNGYSSELCYTGLIFLRKFFVIFRKLSFLLQFLDQKQLPTQLNLNKKRNNCSNHSKIFVTLVKKLSFSSL